MDEKDYCIYILTNHDCTTLYVGVTNDLYRRVLEHRAGQGGAFTKRYQVYRLVYCEQFSDVREAIDREKQLKGGSRKKKLALIEEMNPEWKDLCEEYFG